MFRRSIVFQSDAAAKTAAAVARRKANWIDRRNHKVRHNGKTAFNKHEQPACELCHVRFRWQEDQRAHKDSELHSNRAKWNEQEKWWNNVGFPAHVQRIEEDQTLFKKFLEKRSVASGISTTALAQSMRRAQVNLGPKHSIPVDFPTVKNEIVEPRDQRWPMSPKH